MCCYWAELFATTGLQSVLTHVQRMQLQYFFLCVCPAVDSD